ncbi:hypothetical protein [Leucothrix pacifica]|uniref:hypothetical protein n=1 Tax=Leucothrix pacifica TaxID=1247513 RepID=UPI001C63EC51|nr:hypothetical protein [Leucothrix pacifica]
MKHLSRNSAMQLATAAAVLMTANTAFADVKRVAGANCPAGYAHVTYQKATAQRATYCKSLQAWDIARLANGASMDGSGYQCKTRPSDTRQLGHSLCEKKAVAATKQTSLNQAAYVNGTSEYRFGHNSIPNMKVTGAPANVGFGRFAMLHDGSTYRLYLPKYGSKDTLYQFGFNPSQGAYVYGHNSIKELKIVGMPADANTNSYAMLHDGRDYRLYMRSRSNPRKIYQAAYKQGTNQYVYGHNSIPAMNITKAPADITNNRRWAMLHDGKHYRLYIGRKGRPNQFYQFAFNPATNSYEHGYQSIPLLTAKNPPANSKKGSFAMLHDRGAYRYYHLTK